MVVKQLIRSLTVAICLALSIGCSQEEPAATVETIRPAKLVTVESASVQQMHSFPAVIQAAQSVELTFQASGEVKELNVLEGDSVQLGDIIAQLDQRDANNRLLQAQAEYDNAEDEYQRADSLYAENAISLSVLDSRRTRRAVARATLETSRKALGDTTLKAPFPGRVSRVLVRQFQNVQAKEIIAIIHSNEVEAVMNAPSTIVSRALQIDHVEARIILDAAPDEPIAAQFKEAAGEADQATQTYKVIFSFVTPEGLLILPGMTATIELGIRYANEPDVESGNVAVPLSSILAEGENRYVWLVSEDGVLRKQAVELLPELGETMTVVDGLESGDTIVAAGVSFFHEGMKVRPWTPE